jgi:hypothetical protein
MPATQFITLKLKDTKSYKTNSLYIQIAADSIARN